ncbi:YciI family protein [Rhodopirellula sp. JC740]|uniref:YciI family protein n=1 Tax=Rhodopirellula halodulae TaxID=2894198 RepID=A0ABS8NI91_9BACT|nr:YciI family protein [Rhodopirellula sp. JC740]MCC9643251.1 YciI family protein [Rhodopirellula sp. JC740]
MKYMLLIYSTEYDWTEDERRACMIESMGICEELAECGKWIDSAPLHPVSTSTTVRVREGMCEVTDGPFAETIEQLGGYYIIDVKDQQEAIDIASRLPPAKKGTVEIRRLTELSGELSLPPLQAPAWEEGQPGSLNAGKDYLLMLFSEEGVWQPEEHAIALKESVDLCHELDRCGQYRSASPLEPASSAVCVRVRRSECEVTDGPYPETKEQLAGYFLVHASDLNKAISIASRIPATTRGTTEIRPLFPLPTVNTSSASAN